MVKNNYIIVFSTQLNKTAIIMSIRCENIEIAEIAEFNFNYLNKRGPFCAKLISYTYFREEK